MSMSSPAVGVKDLLVAASMGTFGGTSGWSINVGKLPTTPDTAIACVVTGGLPPSPKWLLNQPSVQVMIRGKANGYVDAENKARAIVDALLGAPTQTVGGDFWGGITQIGDVVHAGYDETNRPLFTCNFSIIVEPKAGGHRQSMS